MNAKKTVHRINKAGDCSCGQDGCTCQACGKRICGSKATWIEGKGNICEKCLDKGVSQMVNDAEKWAKENPGAAGRADAEASRQLKAEAENRSDPSSMRSSPVQSTGSVAGQPQTVKSPKTANNQTAPLSTNATATPTTSKPCLGYDPNIVSGLCRCKNCKDKPREERTGSDGFVINAKVKFVGPKYEHQSSSIRIGTLGTIVGREGSFSRPPGNDKIKIIQVRFEGHEKVCNIGISRLALVPLETRDGQYRSPPVNDPNAHIGMETVAVADPVPNVPAQVSSTPIPVRHSTLSAAIAKSNAEASSVPHLEVPALAGTGKTTTILGGICRLKGSPLNLTPSDQQEAVWKSMELGRSDSIRLSAFNTKITDVLKERVVQQGLDTKGVEARGIHSLGNGAVYKAFGRREAKDYAVLNIIDGIAGTNSKDARRNDPKVFAMINAVDDLVSLCKQTLSEPTPENLDQLCSHYDIETNGSKERIYDLVPKVLNRCKSPKPGDLIHFDDMIWLPIVHNLPIFKVDMQIVDEAQDLNKCQQELMYRAGHRLVVIGDENQAIYGFAGADSDSLNNMRARLHATPRGCLSLPLTMTRRCGKAIVEEAKRYVPNFEAHESNPEGQVFRKSLLKTSPDYYLPMANDGDFVLCRTNAPLVSHCFRFITAGRKANILGRKIGQGLTTLIEKSRKERVPDLISWLGDWLSREEENEQAKKFPSESRMENLRDKHDCVLEFCSGQSSVVDVKNKIESVFTDNKQAKGITLSSIHKSKGLEARRVFILQPPGGPRRDKMQPWELQQENNLKYVAITRAIEELVYVS